MRSEPREKPIRASEPYHASERKMSYCKRGADCDVMIFETSGGFNVWFGDADHPDERDMQVATRSELLDAICMLRTGGVRVPAFVFERVAREIMEEQREKG
jgi:hypothetical protein